MTKIEDLKIDKFRFYIEDEQYRKRSATWHIRSKGSGVYVYVNSISGRIKISFHPEGKSKDGKNSQCGFTKPYRDKLVDHKLYSPSPVRWIGPKPKADEVVLIAQLFFPTDFLRGEMIDERENYQRPPKAKRKRRFALPMAKAGEAVEVSIFYSSKKLNEIEQLFLKAGYMPMVGYELTTGEVASVVAKNVHFDPNVIPNLSKYKGTPLIGFDQISDKEENLSAVMYNHPIDGDVLQCVEVNGLILNKKK